MKKVNVHPIQVNTVCVRTLSVIVLTLNISHGEVD